MITTSRQPGGDGAIVVSVILDAIQAQALDHLCGVTLSSRAGLMRRCLVESLRREGLLNGPAKSPAVRSGAAR